MTKRKRRVAAGATLPASPTPDELVVFPELALVAALQQLLELTSLTLAVIHPVDVVNHSRPRPRDLRATFADQIIELSANLARAATSYRVAAIDLL